MMIGNRSRQFLVLREFHAHFIREPHGELPGVSGHQVPNLFKIGSGEFCQCALDVRHQDTEMVEAGAVRSRARFPLGKNQKRARQLDRIQSANFCRLRAQEADPQFLMFLGI